MTIGVPYDVFWNLNPKKLESFEIAYKNKRHIEDEKMWYMGQYIMSAIDATICNAFRKHRSDGGEYIEKPFMQKEIVKKEKNNYKESQEQIAVYEMKKRTKLLEKQGLPPSPK